MTWNNSAFTEHYKKIKIEGFRLDRLLDKCIKNHIHLKNIRFVNDIEIHLMISSRDLKKLQKLAKKSYKITVLGEGGYKYGLKRLWKRKITLLGILIFAAFLYYQSLFVAEIRVNGYESIDEPHLRQTLAEAGLYEGCRKKIDLNKVKIRLYEEYEQIVWAGVEFEGNRAVVSIAEGEKTLKTDVAKKKPCHIVADRPGYISKIVPIEGQRAVRDGTYVKKGDILITGEIPLQKTTYGTESEGQEKTYVHGEGLVEARIPERIIFCAPRYERIKKRTGRKHWSIAVNGHSLSEKMSSYKTSVKKTKNLIHMVKPFPLKIDAVVIEEAVLFDREIKNRELKRAVNASIRQYVKENLPKKAQILNKSLNFSREKNIINIGVTLETLQQIGTEEEIIVDKSDGTVKKDDHQ